MSTLLQLKTIDVEFATMTCGCPPTTRYAVPRRESGSGLFGALPSAADHALRWCAVTGAEMATDTGVTRVMPGVGGRWISQSSAEAKLGLLSRNDIDELRREGSTRHAEAWPVAAAGKPPRHIQVVRNGELELELMTRMESSRVTMAVVRAGGVIGDARCCCERPCPSTPSPPGTPS
ncbi:MAG: hypothetical protein NVS3B26_13940 [Mycobacteriales bacterium]